jgi:hypothetical protein
MAGNSHNSNAYTDQEKKFLMGPLLIGSILLTVFLYVYSTIPSKPYLLHEAAHAEGAHEKGHEAKH